MKSQFKSQFTVTGIAMAGLEKEGVVADVRYTETGKRVTSFRMNVPYPSKKEPGKNVDAFFDVTAWEDLAARAAEIQNGQVVEVRGFLQQKTFKNKTTGKVTYGVGLIANFIGAPGEKSAPKTTAQATA